MHMVERLLSSKFSTNSRRSSDPVVGLFIAGHLQNTTAGAQGGNQQENDRTAHKQRRKRYQLVIQKPRMTRGNASRITARGPTTSIWMRMMEP